MHTYVEVIYVFDFPDKSYTLRKSLINTPNMLTIQVHLASLNKVIRREVSSFPTRDFNNLYYNTLHYTNAIIHAITKSCTTIHYIILLR